MRGKRILIGVVLLAVVILLNLPFPAALRMKAGARDNAAPIHNLMGLIAGKAWENVSLALRARTAIFEREGLLDDVVRLRHKVQRLDRLQRENRELRALLNYRERSAHELLLGRVVSRGGMTGWWQAVRVNRGSLDGVRPDMAVMTMQGLIGRTANVTERTSDIMLVTDPGSRVACRLGRDGAVGIARGRGVTIAGRRDIEMISAVNPCLVEYVDKESVIEPGDRVLTSGLGGVYPAGLPLGTVIGNELDASGLFLKLDVRPLADLRNLGYVWVVIE